ncbi:MAG: cytochrome b/b6 domain-containing protein [Chloroflexi bacterium]|nr:cytochrome b/b6 domain-containing protein [Chloroflexota bacterium]
MTYSSERVPRFTRTERALHWIHAIAFLALLFTGIAMYSQTLSVFIGRRYWVRFVHILAGYVLVFGPLLLSFFNWRTIRKDMEEMDLWDRDDFAWLKRPWRILWGGETVPQGKFNAGQKLNAIFSAACIVVFGVTGLIMWQFEHFPRWLVSNAILVHDNLSWIAAAVWLGHLYLSVINPSTRESLRGITLGWVRASWAKRHHSKWLEDGEEGTKARFL